MLEEGLEAKKNEKEISRRWSKVPAIPVIAVDPSPAEEAEKEIAQLKEQICGFQGKMMEGTNDKAKGFKQAKRIPKEKIPDMEVESWYGTAEVFPPYRPKNSKRRMGSNLNSTKFYPYY